MDCFCEGLLCGGEQMEQAFVRWNGLRIEECGRDGYEFVVPLLVVDEGVVVECVDNVRDSHHLQWLLHLRNRPQIPRPLGCDEGGQGVHKLLFTVYGLQLEKGVLCQHWR